MTTVCLLVMLMYKLTCFNLLSKRAVILFVECVFLCSGFVLRCSSKCSFQFYNHHAEKERAH